MSTSGHSRSHRLWPGRARHTGGDAYAYEPEEDRKTVVVGKTVVVVGGCPS